MPNVEYDVKAVAKRTILTTDSVYAVLSAVYDDYSDLQALSLTEALAKDSAPDDFVQSEVKHWLDFLMNVKRSGLPAHLAWRALDKILKRPKMRDKFFAWTNDHEPKQLPSKMLSSVEIDIFQLRCINRYIKALLVEDGFKPSIFVKKKRK